MSDSGGIIRDRQKVEASVRESAELLNTLQEKIGADSVQELAAAFQLIDHCLSHYVYLSAINAYIQMNGRSRGSFIITGDSQSKIIQNGVLLKPELCTYDREVENKILEAAYRDGTIKINLEEVREIPKQNLWFEKVWKEYIEDNYPES
jgi:hypothetical protein